MRKSEAAVRHEKAIRQMFAERKSVPAMASALGVHHDTIQRALKKLGLVHPGRIWSDREFNTCPTVKAIRAERMARRIPLKEFARKTGYCRSQVGEWERGRLRMSVPALEDVVQALGGTIRIEFPPR